MFFIATVLPLLSCNTVAFQEKAVIHKSILLKAKKDKVWSALTSENELSQWWNNGVILQAVNGGKFYEPWGNGQLATGETKDFEVEKFIEFSWSEKYWKPTKKTFCRITLKDVDGGTTLTVLHYGWETFKDHKYQKELLNGFSSGWDQLLLKLKKYFED